MRDFCDMVCLQSHHNSPPNRENRDKVEIYLAFGATRVEASKPVVIEALRLALTPTINSMRYLAIF